MRPGWPSGGRWTRLLDWSRARAHHDALARPVPSAAQTTTVVAFTGQAALAVVVQIPAALYL